MKDSDDSANADGQTDLSRGHETRDISIGLILMTAGLLIAFAILVHVGVWGVFRGLRKEQPTEEGVTSPLAMQDARKPLEERLQTVPAPRLEGLEAAKQPKSRIDLEHYGWVDKSQGVIHIPIDLAMRFIVEQDSRQSDKREKGKTK